MPKISSIRSAVLTQIMSVTNRRTDRPTDRIGVAYTALAPRQPGGVETAGADDDRPD